VEYECEKSSSVDVDETMTICGSSRRQIGSSEKERGESTA